MPKATGEFIELIMLHYELMTIMDLTTMYRYKGKSIKKTDGDTFELDYEIIDKNNESIEKENDSEEYFR